MNLQDFATLEAAQAYEEIGSKMISPDMMVAFLTKFGSMASVMTSNTNEALGLQAALNFGSEFNLINEHPLSVVNLVDNLVQDGVIGEPLKTALIGYANPINKPFKDVTQEEFNASKLLGELEDSGTTYPSGLDYISTTKNIRVYIKTSQPAQTNMTVTLQVYSCPDSSDKSIPENFIKEATTLDTIYVSAGSYGGNKIINSTLPKHFKIRGTSNRTIPYEIIVEEV